MAIEFYKEKNGFVCTSNEINYLKDYQEEDYKKFLPKIEKINNTPTKRSIRLLCKCSTNKGNDIASKFWGKNKNPYWHDNDWWVVFWYSRHFLAETKDGKLFFIAPSVIPKLAMMCELEDGGWYKGNFIFKKIGDFASLYPVK